MAAITTTRNSGGIRSLGSGIGWIKRVKANGDDLATPDTWHELPLIKESSIKDDTAENTVEDEGGNKYTTPGARTIEFSGMFLQRDIDTIRLMPKILRDEYVSIVKELTSSALDGVFQHVWFPICTPVNSLDFKLATGEVPFKFNPRPVSASKILNLATEAGNGLTGNSGGTMTGSVTVAVGESYEFFTIS